jgi:ribose 5-phosphate isomerase B
MKIAIGADHAGYELKEHIRQFLIGKGNQVIDVGTNNTDPVDYPDLAEKVALLVATGQSERGIIVCGTGIGVAIAANKIPGVRAANCNDVICAKLSREHNNSNILTMGARLINRELAEEIVEAWLVTKFAGGRHARRVKKINEIEKRAGGLR